MNTAHMVELIIIVMTEAYRKIEVTVLSIHHEDLMIIVSPKDLIHHHIPLS